jgi:L-amino acid N-acyltransferase YncA
VDCICLCPAPNIWVHRAGSVWPRNLRSNVPGATVRDASEDDAPACAAIYAPYVGETALSFEGEPPTPAQMAERIAAATPTHAWVVLEDDDRVVGYAYGGPHQKRAAYRFSCEVSVYVEQGRRRSGSGRALYEALFERLAARGYLMAVAGMTLPNEASVGLHRAMGFEPVGVYRRIGWKLGAWHDVAWVQRALGVEQDPPSEPR